MLRFYLKVICLDMCIIFLFVSVILLFVFYGDRYGTAVTSGTELLVTIIERLQLLPFATEAFIWDLLAVPDPQLLLYFLL